jgi:hypothetical protein
MSTVRYTGPRSVLAARCHCVSSSRISGRPTSRYHGTIAARATLAMIRPVVVSGPASTIAALMANTIA